MRSSVSPAASVPAFMFATKPASPIESRSPTRLRELLVGADLAADRPTSARTDVTPERPGAEQVGLQRQQVAVAGRHLHDRLEPLLDHPAPTHASGDSLTVAAWLSVTLAASTNGASALRGLADRAASGSTGGPSSAVTANTPSDSRWLKDIRGVYVCAVRQAVVH